MRPTTTALLLLARLVQAGQLVLEPEPIQPVDDSIHTQATTTIDILSSSPNHSTFLRLLQRTKLVPTLNLIQGSSIFAPTDEAWSSWGDAQGLSIQSLLSDDLQSDVTDNVLFELRQQLMYHILNYTLHDISSYDNASTTSYVTTETTLLFPNRPMMPPAPSPHKPPTGWPWLPQGGDGDLGGKGQQLRLNYEEGEPKRVGCDAQGDGGSDVWNGWPVKKKGEAKVPSDEEALSSVKDGIVRHASNGVVIGIQRVLEPPPSLGESGASTRREGTLMI
jgi:solute carrier family 25 carnitine/acylcarnitine transporter 20/29